MKKIVLFLLTVSVLFLFTGCRAYYTYDLSKGNDVEFTTELYFAEDEVKQENLGPDYSPVVLEDGKTYYMAQTKSTESLEKINFDNDLGVIRPDMIYIPSEKIDETKEKRAGNNSKLEELYRSMYVKITFIMAEDIVETNGILSDDKRTVTFIRDYNSTMGEFYAYSASAARGLTTDKTPPVIKGLKKNKYYRNLDSLEINDDIGLKTVTCNGIDMICDKSESKGVETRRWYLIRQQKFKQGKNVIVATDISGNTSTFTFLYDNKPPVFKKIKNYASRKKKVVFYVKDKNSGIKKLTYSKDYKKFKKIPQKYVKKVKKGKYKGYYKVTIPCKKSCYMTIRAFDKAGNSSYVTGIKVN